MALLAASLLLLVHAPLVQQARPNATSPTPPTASYALFAWSPGDGMGASISSPNTLKRSDGEFVVNVTMTDTDVWIRSDTQAEVTKGGAAVLELTGDADNGKIDEYGNQSFALFEQDGDVTYPSISDGSKTAKISYMLSTSAPDAYPATRKLKYTVSDTAAYPDPNGWPGGGGSNGRGFVRDLTPVNPSTTVQVING